MEVWKSCTALFFSSVHSVDGPVMFCYQSDEYTRVGHKTGKGNVDDVNAGGETVLSMNKEEDHCLPLRT